MYLYSFKGEKPSIHSSCYIAPGAQIIGKVSILENSSVWHNCVLRGDVNTINIGKNSNIQDLSMLHITEDKALNIGNNVTIGHSVTLHGCDIEDNALIGMGATILDNARIGSYSIVAAGSVVSPGKVFPERSMIMGVPAKVVRALTDKELEMLDHHYLSYVKYASEFKDPAIVNELQAL